MTLAERIASEIMDTIECERRVNKDDLVAAAERVLQQWDKDRHPAYCVEPGKLNALFMRATEYLNAIEVLDAAPVPRDGRRFMHPEEATVFIVPSHWGPTELTDVRWSGNKTLPPRQPSPSRFGTPRREHEDVYPDEIQDRA